MTTQYGSTSPRPVGPSPLDEGPGPIGYVALVLAWAVPGLGHMILGQWSRGIVFSVTIHLLFAGGLLIGGIRAINPPDQAIWTYTQFLSGWPMLAANRVEHQSRAALEELRQEYEMRRPADPESRMRYASGFFARYPVFTYHPKVQDLGAVYCGIAGMLNLLVMFDVLLRITGSVREDPVALRKQRRASAGPPAGGTTPAAEGSQ